MPKSTVFANDVLSLVFRAVSIANIAQNNATSPATAMSIALHTATPAVGGDQSTNEISYTGYARITSVLRDTSGSAFPAPSGGVITTTSNIDFGLMTAGTGGTVTFGSIGHTPSTTTNKMLMFGAVSPTISVVNGVTPRLASGSTITEA